MSSGSSDERVRFDWGPAGLRATLAAAERPVVVVVDVLSFSTAVVVACDAGVLVRPVPPGSTPGPGSDGAVVAGRRGAGVSLSPPSLAGLPRGSRVVLPSPNGAALSHRAADAGARVLVAGLRNAAAAAAALLRLLEEDPEPSALVLAAGEQWPDGSLRPALEDHVGAGAVLAGLPATWLSSEARAAATLARAMEPEALSGCVSALELIESGFAEDVAIAFEVDASSAAPVLGGGWFRDGR